MSQYDVSYICLISEKSHRDRIQIANQSAGSTQFGEWPHMCIILSQDYLGDLYVGGASLIAPGILLTAAHVVK